MSSTVKPTDYASRIANLQVRPDALINERIGITTQTEGGTQVGGTTPAAKPVNLFDTSSYAAASPQFTLADGSTFQLPTMTSEESAQAQSVLAKIPEEHHDSVNQAASQLGQALFQFMVTPQSTDASTTASAGASKVGTVLQGSMKTASPAGAGQVTVSQASPDVAGVTSATQQAAASVKKSGLNYDDTVLSTAYAGVQGLQGQLTQYATYMQNTTKNQNTFRADANELQNAITDWKGDANATQNFTWHYVDDNGHVQTQSGDLTKSQAQDALDQVQAGVSSLGQDTQIQQIQLQQLSQNYQAGIETMSNVLKASYDTTKNTLGNIHY